MVRRLALAACAVALFAAHADAQRARSSGSHHSSGRGVPCGNSYISPDKVCHVGAPSPSAPADTAPHAASTSAARTFAAPPTSPGGAPVPYAGWNPRLLGQGGWAVTDSTAAFVAWPKLGVFLRRGCDAADVVPRDVAIYFKTAVDATSAGFVRSPYPGC